MSIYMPKTVAKIDILGRRDIESAKSRFYWITPKKEIKQMRTGGIAKNPFLKNLQKSDDKGGGN
jgi:hypothetical protein